MLARCVLEHACTSILSWLLIQTLEEFLEFYGRHCHVHKKNSRKAPAPKTLEIPEEPEIPAI